MGTGTMKGMTKPVRMKPVAKDYAYLLKDLERAENRTREKVNPDQKLSLCMIVKNEEKCTKNENERVNGSDNSNNLLG